jgi:anti-sigma regulatory factor (Ser/Thr protein kinase)
VTEMTSPVPAGVVPIKGGRGLMSGGMSVTAPFSPSGVARAAGGGAGPESAAAGSGGSVPVRVPVPPSQREGQDIPMARAWPLRSFLELGAYPGAVPCARLHTRAVLWEWGMGLDETAALVVDEIVTNAVQASSVLGPPAVVRLWLFSDKERLLIMVWDASPHPPARPAPDAGEISEGGRGLMLVEAMSAQWSWYFTRLPAGKVVWAVCTGEPAREGGREFGV